MRKFLVVLDDSRECLNAMRFAALRAAHTGGGVQILSIIPPEEFQHWMGVADLMRQEARERIEAHFEVFAKWMRDKQGVNPELVIREGDPVAEILNYVRRKLEMSRDFPRESRLFANEMLQGAPHAIDVLETEPQWMEQLWDHSLSSRVLNALQPRWSSRMSR